MRVEHVENKMKSLDNRFTNFREMSIGRQSQLREEILKLQRLVEEENNLRNQLLNSKVKEMIEIEQKYTYLIEQEAKVNSNFPSQIFLKYFEEFFFISFR